MKIFLVCLLTVVLAVPLCANSVNKTPGATITFVWDLTPEEEAGIAAVEVVMLKLGSNITGVPTILGTVAPSVHTLVSQAPVSLGTFYYAARSIVRDSAGGESYGPFCPYVSVNVFANTTQVKTFQVK